MSHTPGPWKLGSLAGKRTGAVHVSARGKIISKVYCALHGVENHQRPLEGAENARLIAAAPDLLEALEVALLCIDDEVNVYAPEMCDAARVREAQSRHAEGGTLHYYARTISKARAAIKKAKGEA